MTELAARDRRDRLASLVESRGFLRVVDASAQLGVSEVTVRGDLSALERQARVIRVHGGAVPRRENAGEPTVEEALERDADAKRRIGVAAAALVSSGQSVLLDVGSTALAVARALVERDDLVDVSIITNGLSTALALEPAVPRFSVVLTGGTLRPLQHSLVDPGATSFLESVHADLAFVGCNGVDADRGVTNLNYPEAEVKRRMLGSTSRRIVIADGSKIGRIHLGLVAGLDGVDLLVTAGEAAAGALAALAQRGLAITRV